MKIIERQIKGIDGSNALLTAYVLDDNLDSEGGSNATSSADFARRRILARF